MSTINTIKSGPIQPGEVLPNCEDLSIRLPSNVTKKITVWEVCGREICFLIFHSGAFEKSSDGHLENWISAVAVIREKLKNSFSDIRIVHVVPHNRHVARAWVKSLKGDTRSLLPDWRQEFIKSVHLDVDKTNDQIGIASQQAIVVTRVLEEKPVVVYVAVEPDLDVGTEKTSPVGIITKLSEIIQKSQVVLEKFSKKKTEEQKTEKKDEKDEGIKTVKDELSTTQKKEISLKLENSQVKEDYKPLSQTSIGHLSSEEQAILKNYPSNTLLREVLANGKRIRIESFVGGLTGWRDISNLI